jgi:hypothetical protein
MVIITHEQFDTFWTLDVNPWSEQDSTVDLHPSNSLPAVVLPTYKTITSDVQNSSLVAKSRQVVGFITIHTENRPRKPRDPKKFQVPQGSLALIR